MYALEAESSMGTLQTCAGMSKENYVQENNIEHGTPWTIEKW